MGGGVGKIKTFHFSTKTEGIPLITYDIFVRRAWISQSADLSFGSNQNLPSSASVSGIGFDPSAVLFHLSVPSSGSIITHRWTFSSFGSRPATPVAIFGYLCMYFGISF